MLLWLCICGFEILYHDFEQKKCKLRAMVVQSCLNLPPVFEELISIKQQGVSDLKFGLTCISTSNH